jgi:hypothetical protein
LSIGTFQAILTLGVLDFRTTSRDEFTSSTISTWAALEIIGRCAVTNSVIILRTRQCARLAYSIRECTTWRCQILAIGAEA